MILWRKKRILLTVKAYPEKSTKYGSVVCIAGITDDMEWIRIYPLPFELFRGGKTIPKYSWIEVECKKVKGEKLRRKESYRIRTSTLKVVDRSLAKQPVDWEARNKVVMPMKNESIEDLEGMFEDDRTSLGLIRPHKVFDFYCTEPLEEFDTNVDTQIQMTVDGQRRTILEKIPHVFKYRFACGGECNGHDMTCEDWELLQSFRSWRSRYDETELWEKIRQKYYDYFLKKRNLHFYMGMHSIYPVWMIIGLYYPPKGSG